MVWKTVFERTRPLDNPIHLQATVLDRVAHAVVAVGTDGRILYGNAAAHRLLGWAAGDLAGLVIGQCLATALPSKVPDGVFDGTGLRRDGTDFPAEITAAVLTDESGAAFGMALTLVDLASRQHHQRQAVNAALAALAAGLAHDASQSLHVIRLTAEALELGLQMKTGDTSLVAARARTILVQVDRLTEKMQRLTRGSDEPVVP